MSESGVTRLARIEDFMLTVNLRGMRDSVPEAAEAALLQVFERVRDELTTVLTSSGSDHSIKPVDLRVESLQASDSPDPWNLAGEINLISSILIHIITPKKDLSVEQREAFVEQLFKIQRRIAERHIRQSRPN